MGLHCELLYCVWGGEPAISLSLARAPVNWGRPPPPGSPPGPPTVPWLPEDSNATLLCTLLVRGLRPQASVEQGVGRG